MLIKNNTIRITIYESFQVGLSDVGYEAKVAEYNRPGLPLQLPSTDALKHMHRIHLISGCIKIGDSVHVALCRGCLQ